MRKAAAAPALRLCVEIAAGASGAPMRPLDRASLAACGLGAAAGALAADGGGTETRPTRPTSRAAGCGGSADCGAGTDARAVEVASLSCGPADDTTRTVGCAGPASRSCGPANTGADRDASADCGPAARPMGVASRSCGAVVAGAVDQDAVDDALRPASARGSLPEAPAGRLGGAPREPPPPPPAPP